MYHRVTNDAPPGNTRPRGHACRRVTIALALCVAFSAGAETPSLVVGTKATPPFAMQPTATDTRWHGLSIELWEAIARDLNLPFEYQALPLEQLLNSVQSGDIDIAVAALSVTGDREQIVDFSHPYYQSNLGVAVRAGDGPGLNVLTALFSVTFLRAVGVLTLILAAVGAVVWVFERRSNPDEFGGGTLRGLANGFWWSAVTMTTVGYGDKSPRTFAGRMLAIVWMFASIIIIASITGAIASAFTMQSLQSSIEDVDDVLAVSTGTVANSTSQGFLRAGGAAPRSYPDLAIALAALRRGEVTAVVYDRAVMIHQIAATHAGALDVLPLRFRSENYAIAMAEGDPRREAINRALLKITASREWEGIMRRHGLAD